VTQPSAPSHPLHTRVWGRPRRHPRAVFAATVMDGLLGNLARLAGGFRAADPGRYGVTRQRDLAYRDGGSPFHLLDIYRPSRPAGPGPHPCVLYIHGGGFRVLSKDSHWLMGIAFARRGYTVLNVNYRLAPASRYPAAIEDVCQAFLWAVEHARELNIDLDRLAIAGESAGANLTAALAVATAYERPEPWARAVFETGVQPRAVCPAAGILQVSDPGRFRRKWADLPRMVDAVIHDVAACYLPLRTANLDLADPLVFLEQGRRPDRPLPPFYVPVGTRDPLLDDTRRLERALWTLGVPVVASYFPGEVHAFHALTWRPAAKACWREMLDFVDERCRPEAPLRTPRPAGRRPRKRARAA
jgi:acetyl esterase